MSMGKILLRLPADWFDAIDSLLGDQTRTDWIREAIADKLPADAGLSVPPGRGRPVASPRHKPQLLTSDQLWRSAMSGDGIPTSTCSTRSARARS